MDAVDRLPLPQFVVGLVLALVEAVDRLRRLDVDGVDPRQARRQFVGAPRAGHEAPVEGDAGGRQGPRRCGQPDRFVGRHAGRLLDKAGHAAFEQHEGGRERRGGRYRNDGGVDRRLVERLGEVGGHQPHAVARGERGGPHTPSVYQKGRLRPLDAAQRVEMIGTGLARTDDADAQRA